MFNKWASLHSHDFFSMQDALPSPLQNLEQAVKLDLYGMASTQHGSMGGIIKWQKSRKQLIEKFTADKERTKDIEEKDKLDIYIERTNKIKIINGIELYVKVDEKVNSHLVILAKNLAGYKKLIKIASEATKKENFYRKPRLSLEQIAAINNDKNLISFSGHCGSELADCLFSDIGGAYSATTYEQAKSFIHPDWKRRLFDKIDQYIQTFGKDNFSLEVQRFDANRMPAQEIIAKTLRWVAPKVGLHCVATADSHYCRKEQAVDQRILICSLLQTTLPKVKRQLAIDPDDVGMSGFFLSDKYYLPSVEEIESLHEENELKRTIEIADSIEDYSLANKPIIPKFDCPNGLSSADYMRQLCREGWKEKLIGLSADEKNVYVERVKQELNVLQSAGLSDYFLIVQDIMNWTKSQSYLVNTARGSVGGSLIANLLGITSLNPIQYGLIFERFYNAGRNTKDHTSLPDIDCDVQASIREKVINYIKDKYRHECVGQISNYGRLMGRACLKDVLRAHEACSAAEANKICSFLVDESAIADDLQEMREEEGESSIIKWGLENNSKELKEWAYLTPEGNIEGEFAEYFKQAIRLEGTYRQRGRHAAGLVIFPEDITNICPVVYEKDGTPTISLDMHDIEYVGGVKLDILGISALDCIADAENSIRNEFLGEYNAGKT